MDTRAKKTSTNLERTGTATGIFGAARAISRRISLCSLARGAKGKGLTAKAQPRVDQGQSSAGSSQVSTLDLAIRLKPTTSDHNLVVTIPTHSEMICDNTLIAVPPQPVAEGPLGMEEVAKPGATSAIHDLSTSKPPDVAMALVGQADCSGSCPSLLEALVPSSLEPEDIQVERSVEASR
ncbi:hypothetical protein K2173_018732 [Erythroxylum novogranatense]|uniref:Uncharacterized protein n=1 Tax=Erythroxylum novogranatense TaxID=1862640 RepID=A0AAV8SB39_9ROSI|nr:hypothetical protein K2173_018732 [Erythroxylum novogranatense]